MMDLMHKKYFTIEAYTIDGLMYEVNYYIERGWKTKGSFIKEGDKYIQIMKNPNKSIGY